MKINSLHYIRGIAALFVLFTHLVNKLNWDFKTNIFIQAISSFGTEAVVVFFILSGIVISHATLEVNTISINKYFIKRAKRILPLTYLSIFFALIVYFVINHSLPTLSLILGNLFFLGTLEGLIVPVISTIDPLWSLSFEVFFYLFFAVFILKYREKGFYVWLSYSILAILLVYFNAIDNNYLVFINRIFAYSIIWLFGYIIYSYRVIAFSMIGSLQIALLFFMLSRVVISNDYYEPLKWAISALVLVPLFANLYRRKIDGVEKKSKYEFVIIVILYVLTYLYFSNFTQSVDFRYYLYVYIPVLPLLFHFDWVRNFGRVSFSLSKPMLNYLGDISFPLYIIHYPLLMLINHVWDSTSILKPIVSIVIVFLSATVLNKAVNKIFV